MSKPPKKSQHPDQQSQVDQSQVDFLTADLCDEHSEHLQICEPLLSNFGGRSKFYGEIVTLKLHEDNTFVRQQLASAGLGRVLVVDGGASVRCALVGDQLAKLAVDHHWAGIIVNGCIRDSDAIAEMNIGLKALDTHPLKSVKNNVGQLNIPVRFADVTFRPGEFVYSDNDGIVVSEKSLF